MNRKTLDKIQKELDSLRQKGGIKSREVKSLAKKLHRKLSDRGSEPTWVSTVYPEELRPLSIPDHPGDLNRHTARSILDQLETDIERFDFDLDD
jgi:hypothetical protein